MTLYRHTQFGWVTSGSMLLAVMVGVSVAWRVPTARTTVPLVAGLLLLVTAALGSLTVSVDEGWLECRFGVGLIRRRIRLADIKDVQAVRNHWWYGWGIRLTPHGWLWNVSGLDAVELTFDNGKRFRLGTDEPGRLVAALHSALRSSMS